MDVHYIKNPLPEVFNVRAIYTIHYFKYGRNFTFPSESHDFWELVYVDGGVATAVAGGKEIPLVQGEAVLHAPNVPHTIRTDDEFASAAIISFESTSRAMKQLSGKVMTFGHREKALLKEIIDEGSETYREKLNDLYLFKMNKRDDVPFGSEQIIKNDIENLLVCLSRSGKREIKSAEPPHTKTDEIAARITQILKDGVYSRVTLDEIAAELYFSKTYIKNVFKRATGTSIIQYYIDLKVEEAKKLISRNRYSFTEIADKLSISSVHYFSRMFKERTGMSPSEYAGSIKVDNLIK